MIVADNHRIVVPEAIKDRVLIQTRCQLSEEEILCINGALMALENGISEHPVIHTEMRLNAIFADQNFVNLCSNTAETVALQLDCAIFFVQRWRVAGFDQFFMIATILEEFCHYFWMIKDEIHVLDKVRELIHHLIPNEPEIDRRIQLMQREREKWYPVHGQRK